MGNLGTAMAGKGCQLVYGEQKPTLDYQVLTNPGLDLNWLPAHSNKRSSVKNALTNRCEVADKMGGVHNLEDYDVQLGIPHRWRKGLPKKTIPTGSDCTYFICRAKVLNNVLLGKTEKSGSDKEGLKAVENSKIDKLWLDLQYFGK